MRNKFVRPALHRDHPVWYWALWGLWYCIVGFVLFGIYNLWPVHYVYDSYNNYGSRSEDIMLLLMVGFVVITGAGAVLGSIGANKVIKDEKRLLDGQKKPMNKVGLIDVFCGLVFSRPVDSSGTYTVVLRDPKQETDYLVKITSELYIELKEFYDHGHLGFVVGENFK